MAVLPLLPGFTIAITGGAGGLGKAIAEAFLQSGGNVAVCDVNQDRMAQCEQEWQEKHPGSFLITKTDITDEDAVSAWIGEVLAKFARLDMVVNNAGIMDRFDPVASISKEMWDRVIAINLTGTFLVTKAAVAAMEAGAWGGGTIINAGSVASHRGLVAGLAYTASKHGVVGITKNTAGMYGDQGIYSVCILLGAMSTNIADNIGANFNPEGMKRMGATNPGCVEVAVSDVAKYCLFLADRAIAEASNGSCVTFGKNWPAA